MDLVSQLCFGDDLTPPEDAVIRRLMGYITRRSAVDERLQKLKPAAAAAATKTKKMFDEAIDATPVVRSFLLQLLLKSESAVILIVFIEFCNFACFCL